MTRNNQKWYDKPATKLILITIAITWMFPIFGFLLSSFRPGESIKRTSWWDAIYTGTIWSELSFDNYVEVFRAENLDRSFYNSLAVTIPSTIIPITIAAFATLTLLTKNSFLDEINKQYVMTARAKGLTEFNVFYGHVFRNAMLIVISGFPALFVGIFFGGSLIIEVIFSLDGLGLLGYEAAINRDYQVFFATLYIFALIGLLVKLLSDLTYIWIDPRIDFGSRET